MIESVSLDAFADGNGYEAKIRLDPILVKAAAEQQGHLRTLDDIAVAAVRRHEAIRDCVDKVNSRLQARDRIRIHRVVR